MKKIKLSIAGLMLSGLSYSQSVNIVDSLEYNNIRNYDTIASGIAGNIQFDFNYKTSKIIKKVTTKKLEDFTIEVKQNQILYVDLYDNCKCNKIKNFKKERKIRVYTRDNKISISWENSGDATLKFDGNIVKKVVIEKPVTN